MQNQFRRRSCLRAALFMAVLLFCAGSGAQSLSWGVNGAGGSGNWDTTTANWFNGTQNVPWPTGGNAIFGGASGGTVTSFFFGPVVSSMTFNTPGYTIQNGYIKGGSSGLTVTTNVDATISSTLDYSVLAGNSLVKSGPAALLTGGTNFFGAVQVNQGELRTIGSSDLFFSTVNLANTSGVTVTFAQTSSFADIGALTGGGTLGGVVQPNNQARTVTLTIWDGGTFAGTLQDNGSGILSVELFAGNTPETLTNVNTYSGATSITAGTLALSGNGSALNSSISVYSSGVLLLDDSNTLVANRISDSATFRLSGGTVQLKGNSTSPVEEVGGTLSLTGASNITVTQPASAATQLTFAGLQRIGHATLNISGPGVEIPGVSNGSTGIVSPFITSGADWARVGGDGRITSWTAYTTDINSGSASDHVKLTATGTTILAATTTRASLNLQNIDITASQIVDLAGHNLTLTSGGILSSGAGTATIRNGSLSSTASELVVTANNNLTIAATIVNGSSATTLTKTGSGVLTLSGANTYSGTTEITQGSLVVASDANLGAGTTIDFCGGTLKAAGSFSSSKGFTNTSSVAGSVDSAGYNLSFSGANTGSLSKTGSGTLMLTNPAIGTAYVNAGVLVLPNVASGTVYLESGTLQAAGTLSTLDCTFSSGISSLDIGGSAAARLTTPTFRANSSGNLQIDFGLGRTSSDFWAITSGSFFLPSNSGAIQFEFQNLGGVTTSVDYPLMSYFTPFAPPASDFAFAPDMAAAGWAGTFKTTTTGVSVRFSSVPVPEPAAMILLLQGALIAFATFRHCRRRSHALDRQAS